MKKIDFHCHTTKRKLEHVIPASATLDAIAAKMKEHEIVESVLLATYFPHKGSGISNFQMYHWIQEQERITGQVQKFTMFGSLDFEHYFYQGFNELEELAGMTAMGGIKIYTCYQKIDLNSQKMSMVAELAKHYGLPILFHVGSSYQAKRTLGRTSVANLITPRDVADFARNHAELDVVIAHLGTPFVDECIAEVSQTANLYADMSGLIDSQVYPHEIPESVENVRRFVSECGSEKLLFGSDFPVTTHEDAIYFIEEGMKDFSLQDRQNVYYNNARRLLCQH